MDTTMTDMKMSKAEKKMYPRSVGSTSGPDFPWGLEVRLDSAALKKLGIESLPAAGEDCMIHAMGQVTRVEESATEKNQERSMTIQITKLSLSQAMGKESDDDVWNGVKKDRKG